MAASTSSANACATIQKSLGWCQGKPELPGVKKRVYYIPSSDILKWPALPKDTLGRPTSALYDGDFTLREGAKWHYIDHLPSKAEVKTETQGEKPSQTVKATMTIVHPGVGEEASTACAGLLNTDSIFLVEDMSGSYRVIGSEYYDGTATVAQDLGQGATGTTGTTITLEGSDIVSLPIYAGKIETEEGTINESV